MVDPVFGTDDFGRTKILSENETFTRNFITLLLGKPGFYPSIPNIGIDISQYLYKFTDEINVDELKAKIALQCSDFLPSIQSGNFDIIKTVMNNRVLLIFILPGGDNGEKKVALCVTTNEQGEVIYRFVENQNQIL